jgi:L-amino acid N-acyltransferase YncA
MIIRPMHHLDAPQMARLLNEIITAGGTTALTATVTPDEIVTWARARDSAWHVAESAADIVGFQWIEPWDSLPPEAANIATFVQAGRTGLGIGSKLFDATRAAARKLGYTWINANIRADNESGLTYYQSRGFRDWHSIIGYQLDNGDIVNKVWKRFDL